MKLKIKFTFLLSSLSVIPVTSYGTGIEQGYQNSTAAGRGNAYIASVDDASAVHYNPAALSLAEKTQIQVNNYLSFARIKKRGTTNFTHNENVAAGSLFFNRPNLYDGNLALGFGITIPHGLGLDYGDDNPLRTLGTKTFLAHVRFSPAVSYKINDKLSIGATVSYAYDDYEAEQGIIVPGDSFNFSGTGHGWGYSLGALYKLNPQWTIGATFKSSLTSKIKGTATTNALFPAPLYLEESASTTLKYPKQFILGVAYKPNNDWLFEFNAQWSDWSSFDTVVLKKASGDTASDFSFQETILLNIGASKRLTDNLDVNFGYLFSTPAAPSKTYSPFVPNSETHTVALGLDYEYDAQWKFSTSVVWINTKNRTVTGSTTSPISGVNSDGSWDTSGFTVVSGLTYSF